MRDNDEITGLFRNRLTNTEMTVQDGFWEKLQKDLSQTEAVAGQRKTLLLSPRLCRIAAAASVIFVLGVASAAFWYFSPKEEIKEAFTQVATMTPDGSLNGDVVQETFPSIHQTEPVAQKPGMKQPAGIPASVTAQEEDETVSVRVSITISQRVYGNQQQTGNGFFNNGLTAQAGNGYQSVGSATDTNPESASSVSMEEDPNSTHLKTRTKLHKWALKTAIGTSLPKGNYHMPLTAGITMERVLNNRLALETGIQYNRLHADRTLHTLGIPVKLNVTLASTSTVDLYATVGGAAEKCIAGAVDNSFSAEPVQLSVAAGIGIRYKLNDRFALFAEPSVSHHFDTESETKTLRTERATNLNLLCGVRMTY